MAVGKKKTRSSSRKLGVHPFCIIVSLFLCWLLFSFIFYVIHTVQIISLISILCALGYVFISDLRMLLMLFSFICFTLSFISFTLQINLLILVALLIGLGKAQPVICTFWQVFVASNKKSILPFNFCLLYGFDINSISLLNFSSVHKNAQLLFHFTILLLASVALNFLLFSYVVLAEPLKFRVVSGLELAALLNTPNPMSRWLVDVHIVNILLLLEII